jgi:S1-C subfamily serine protease
MMVGHRAGKTDADFHFGRVIGTWSRPEEPRFYRIDLADCQGACGDAVLDEDGALRGIIVGVRAQREDDLGPVPGASTANPLECEWVRALSATGIGEEITRLDLSSRTPVGYLGVSAGEAEPPRGGRDTGSSRLPLLVTQVLPGSPADAAGIRPKDQIVSIDGHPITSMEQVAGAIAATPPGQRVVVRLLRDGLPLELSAKLADRSALDWLDRQSRRDAGRRKMLEAGIDRLQRQVREMDMEARRAP